MDELQDLECSAKPPKKSNVHFVTRSAWTVSTAVDPFAGRTVLKATTDAELCVWLMELSVEA